MEEEEEDDDDWNSEEEVFDKDSSISFIEEI